MGRAGRWCERRTVMDAAGVESVLAAMAGRIAASGAGHPMALVGIQTGGAFVARRMHALLARMGLPDLPLGQLDIGLYRDDTFLGREQPVLHRTDIPFEVTGMGVVLVDDVLYTGRTVKAALDALVDFGRPRFIRLAVLVDRGLREYPIQADVTGLAIDTAPDETVQVELTETGAPVDRVVVYGL